MEFRELVGRRYSVKKFSDRPVEAEKLNEILEAGRLAPTAKNSQPQRIYVLQSAEAIKKMEELSPCVYGAKTVLLFAYNENEEFRNPLEKGIHSGVEDVSIVATHVMLRAADIGLGTCWCNFFPNSRTAQAFGLPPDEKAVLFMPVGYAAPDAAPLPPHSSRKPLSETVKYL